MARRRRKDAHLKTLPPTSFKFKKLNCWKVAKIAVLFSKGVPTQFGDLKNQLERAALSVSNNIAEACQRHPKGGKNVENLLSSANGSLGETYNLLDSALDLNANSGSLDGEVFRLFIENILVLAAHELVCLINNTSLIDTPDTLKVFKPEDALVLDHILKEVRAGKEIRQILSDIIVQVVQERMSSVDSANGVLPSELCIGCNKRRHIDKGKDFKISVVTDLSSGKFCFPVFLCDYCTNAHGAPKEIDHGKIVWKSREFVQEEVPASCAAVGAEIQQ